MSLIIAIEPDREQANQLKELVRRHTKAELVLADTTERAIGVIEQRVPDLVLIPPFLSPQDDEALTKALRVSEAASHVQTLTIPVLGAPEVKASQPGMLSRLLREQPRASSPDSCDPKVFADQITAYLERITALRGPMKTEAAREATNGGGRKHDRSAGTGPKPVVKTEVAAKPPEGRRGEKYDLAAALAEFEVKHAATDHVPGTPAVKSVAPTVVADEAVDEITLAEGLSSLMERLDAEDESKPQEPPPELDLTSALDDVMKAEAKPITRPRNWPEKLRRLESQEWAMPSNLPREVESAQAVQTPIVATPLPAPKTSEPVTPPAKPGSEWGDLLESLQKEIKR